MVLFQIYKIDIRLLTVYCKGILCWKNVLVFVMTSQEGGFVELPSGCELTTFSFRDFWVGGGKGMALEVGGVGSTAGAACICY